MWYWKIGGVGGIALESRVWGISHNPLNQVLCSTQRKTLSDIDESVNISIVKLVGIIIQQFLDYNALGVRETSE